MKYIICNKDNNAYFEQDFAGWSWQKEMRMAYKFRDKESAEGALAFLEGEGELEIVEVQ